jgi:putative flavoprotein involved in K+ transport
MGFHAEQRDYDVVIVGAGPAGLGVGAALARLEQVNFVVLERGAVGASFRNWHDKMRMITPSFNAGGFGYPDLNAIAPRTSPAYSIRTEHPTGQEYADYLEAFADHYELPVQTGVAVAGVVPDGAGFVVQTSAGDFRARFVVWAAGEFFYPRIPSIPGSQWGVHFGAVRQWEPIEGSFPLVTATDESTLTPNLFLAGPALRHDDIIFCFIYKFRQRFPVIAATIAARMGIDAAPLEEYRLYNMYLDDLSCCDDTCEC